MCDFKPGDEVVFIGDPDEQPIEGYADCTVKLVRGAVYRCTGLFDDGVVCTCCGHSLWVTLVEGGEGDEWSACSFRKVQHRDLNAWLATENTIEEPKRTPAAAPA